MNYYKARMYSPTLGRFMQPDPIGYGDGMNLYAYVGGDPVNFVDPSGLFGTSYNCPQADVVCDDDDGPLIATVTGRRLSYCEKEANFANNFCNDGFRLNWDAIKPCAQAESGTSDFVDNIIAGESSLFSTIEKIGDSAVVVGYFAAPFNPAVGGVLIAGGKLAGNISTGVQAIAAVTDYIKNGNTGGLVNAGSGLVGSLIGGRIGAKYGRRLFGSQQISNSRGQFGPKRLEGIRQFGASTGNIFGSNVCPN